MIRYLKIYNLLYILNLFFFLKFKNKNIVCNIDFVKMLLFNFQCIPLIQSFYFPGSADVNDKQIAQWKWCPTITLPSKSARLDSHVSKRVKELQIKNKEGCWKSGTRLVIEIFLFQFLLTIEYYILVLYVLCYMLPI